MFDSTEGRYAEVAREMLETGDYLEPTLNYQPHWTKPPLTYWAIAAGMRCLGENEWGVRLYVAVAFVFTVWLVFLIGETLWDGQTGVVAGLIYATSPFAVIGGYSVCTDPLLVLWETLAVFAFVKAARAPASYRPYRLWLHLMWLAFGLGFLTKGPPSLLPLLPMVVWRLFSKRPARLVTLPGVASFLVVGLTWYIVVMLRHADLFAYFVLDEIWGRVATDEFGRNHQWYKPFTVYFLPLLAGLGAWSVYGIQSARKRELYKPSALWTIARSGEYGSFLLLWFSLPLAVFVVSQSRLTLYVLPLTVPLVLAIARGMALSWQRLCEDAQGRSRKRVAMAAAASCLALIAGKGVLSFAYSDNNMRMLYEWCMESAPGGTTMVCSFKEGELNGLQFYLKGRLRRYDTNEPEPGVERYFDELADAVKTRSPHEHFLIIASDRRVEKLELKLEALDFTYSRKTRGEWHLFQLPPVPAASPGSLARLGLPGYAPAMFGGDGEFPESL